MRLMNSAGYVAAVSLILSLILAGCGTPAEPVVTIPPDVTFAPALPPVTAAMIGVRRDTTFLLRTSMTAGTPDISVGFGEPADIPIMGDWDGNGTDTLGVFRPSNGTFYLRNSNTLGDAEISFKFGESGDLPIVGDWDGDGKETVGVFRKGQFLLSNVLQDSEPAHTIVFGADGDLPVVGDWQGNSRDQVGIFRPSEAVFLLSNVECDDQTCIGQPDVSIQYGAADDIPLAGDWDGDGRDTIGVYRLKEQSFLLRNSLESGVPDISVNFGADTDVPLVGVWQ